MEQSTACRFQMALTELKKWCQWGIDGRSGNGRNLQDILQMPFESQTNGDAIGLLFQVWVSDDPPLPKLEDSQTCSYARQQPRWPEKITQVHVHRKKILRETVVVDTPMQDITHDRLLCVPQIATMTVTKKMKIVQAISRCS